MRYLQSAFDNENQGLSFYEEKRDVSMGLSGLDFGGIIGDAAFNGVATALGVYIFQNVGTLKKATITASPSYVPDMLRLYMETVSSNRKAYAPADYEKFWLPLYVQKGFDPEIVKLFFERFYGMNGQGLVPRGIWFPSPQSSNKLLEQTTGAPVPEGGISTGAVLGIGAGVIAGITGLYLAFK